MSNQKIKKIIVQTIKDVIKESLSSRNINKLTKQHQEKIHFIPVKYRIIGGILQGLNIKFGNFIEKLIQNIIDIDTSVEVHEDSGKKLLLYFSSQTDSLIDKYITDRQNHNTSEDCTTLFSDLLNQILAIEKNLTNSQRQGLTKDVDCLFKTKNNLLVYSELKYNDDHDTGKFVDINRKFIKTWAGLAVRFKITKVDQLLPVIYYFNRTRRYNPIYTPSANIMRGEQFFDNFLEYDFSMVDKYLREIGESEEILKLFDNILRKVRN